MKDDIIVLPKVHVKRIVESQSLYTIILEDERDNPVNKAKQEMNKRIDERIKYLENKLSCPEHGKEIKRVYAEDGIVECYQDKYEVISLEGKINKLKKPLPCFKGIGEHSELGALEELKSLKGELK